MLNCAIIARKRCFLKNSWKSSITGFQKDEKTINHKTSCQRFSRFSFEIGIRGEQKLAEDNNNSRRTPITQNIPLSLTLDSFCSRLGRENLHNFGRRFPEFRILSFSATTRIFSSPSCDSIQSPSCDLLCDSAYQSRDSLLRLNFSILRLTFHKQTISFQFRIYRNHPWFIGNLQCEKLRISNFKKKGKILDLHKKNQCIGRGIFACRIKPSSRPSAEIAS